MANLSAVAVSAAAAAAPSETARGLPLPRPAGRLPAADAHVAEVRPPAPPKPLPRVDVRPVKHVRRLRAIYTQEQSDNAIHRERCRADRTGQAFSLVLFRMARSIGPSRSMLRLARTVLTRSRTTDEVGWYDDHTVCALLPDTAGTGAHHFADNVARAFADPGHRPQVTIYTYPGTWLDAHTAPCDDGPRATAARPEAARPEAARPEAARPEAARPAAAPGPRSAAELMPFVSRGLNDSLAAGGQLAGGRFAVASLSSDSPSPDSPSPDSPSPDSPSPAPAAADARPLTVLLARPMPWWKRTMDVAGALFGLAAFAPALVAIAVAIRVSDPGPVFFCQRRAGLGGRPFKIYKFRTMCVDAEARKAALRSISEQDGPAFKLKRDPRVTGIGHLLRKTSLDELPQLINVLKGDMSLVGPRPLPLDEQGGAERWQQTRLDVTPGLTCVWQVKGRSTVTFAEWVRMDVGYIHRRTLWTDLKILFQTVPAVLLRRGAR